MGRGLYGRGRRRRRDRYWRDAGRRSRDPGKIVYGPDLSLDSPAELRNLDANGHGTFMAGIIAGAGAARIRSYAGDQTNFLGVAPDSRIVSVKVGASTAASMCRR